MTPDRSGPWGNAALVAALVLLAAPFALHAVGRGLSMSSPEEQAVSRFLSQDAAFAGAALYLHMIAGGAITVLAPLQLLRSVRRRWPALHRVCGRLVIACAILTGAGGLAYIWTRGTIGGPVMDAGFGLYGALMLLAGWRTVSLARRRDPRHPLWGERLVILALASWLYRVHYGLWEIATGGLGSRDDFTGTFDRVQVLAFFLPYLALHHWYRRHRPVRV
jgi:hypothetical protein